MVLGPAGSYHLRDGTVVGENPLTPYGPLAPRHLARLDGIEHVGDLALISRVDEGTEMVAAFEELIGSHGGLGGWQTRASLLYPADWAAPEDPLLGAPVHRLSLAGVQPGGRARHPRGGGGRPVDRLHGGGRVLGFPRVGRAAAAADHPRASPVVPRPGAAQSRRDRQDSSTACSASSATTSGSISARPTLVTVRHRGIVISEPSVVAMDTRSKRVLAIGAEAKRMVGRTPANSRHRPLRDGVISDFDVTEQMIRYFIAKVHERFAQIRRPRVLVGIPSGVTEVEKRAVRDATVNAGARWARLIEEPMAAAIGAGLPVSEPSGSLIVDIGGGTTEVAVISLGGIVVSRSVRVGGDEMDTDIVGFARREYNLLMGERTAEEIKIAVGSAYPVEEARAVTFRGRDLLTGLPRSVEVGSDQIREAPGADGGRDHRRHQGDDRGDAAGAGGRHHGPGHRAGRRRRAAGRPRQAGGRGDPDAGPHRRRSVDLRGTGTGRVLEDLDTLERVLVSEQFTRAPR